MNTITLKENGNKITKMNRHPILSALPMLPKARLKVSTNQLDSLLTTLWPIAQRMQSRQPRAFYSVRQISTHFGVHVSTVSRVYDVLKSEGILTTVRGSRSMLQGTVADRQLSVRGIVGVPLSIKSFVRFQDYRVFALRLQHELRCNGFAAVLAFHEDDEA
jgi:hypothetical protein